MRRSYKNLLSPIVLNELNYIVGNSANNKKIADLLLDEQKKFCAYTDEYISRTDAGDIEHFDPTLKDTAQDNYYNWFIVKHQWNKEKSNKWAKCQPVLHPTADDFEERIIYVDGDYVAKLSTDIEAVNLIKLLKLDDAALAEKRKKYIARKRMEIDNSGENAKDYFIILINAEPCGVSYLRAIKEGFGIDLWQYL